MTPQELKNSILQLAIQGKLVEQHPEEGTGKKLYQQIQKERQELIKSGKLKQDKRIEGLQLPQTDEIPFEIPEAWQFVYLGSILNKLTDGTHRTPKYTTSGVKFVSVKDMSNGILSLDNTKYISITEHEELFARCDPSHGDMLLSKVGTTGVPAIVDTDEPFSLFVSVALLKYCHSCISERFLYYLLQSPLVQQQAQENTRGVGNKNWVLDAIAKTIVVLPPLAEQKRIVAKIEELLPLIDRYEKAWNRLEEFNKRFPDDLQKSLLQMAIQGEMVEQRAEEGTGEELYQQIQIERQNQIASGKAKKGKVILEIEEEKPFSIPTNWNWVHLNSIYNFIDYRGITPNKLDAGIRLIGSGNIRKRHLDFSKEDKYISPLEYETRKSRGLTKEGDILFITEGGSMGFASLNTWKGECSCGQRVITFQQYGNHPLLDNEFFLNCILSEYFQHAIRERITGSAALGIKGDTLKRILVPLPPLAEQHRIVARLEELLPLCEKLKQ